MASATPVAMVAKEFGVSQSALFRYKASRFGRIAAQDAAEKERVLDYLAVTADSLRDADSVRRAALANNDSNLVLKASLVIERLTKLLALRLGVDGSNTAHMLADGDAVVTALASVIRDTPGVASEMIKNLKSQGQHALAGEFEDYARTLESSSKEIAS
jgi:transposase-like protein